MAIAPFTLHCANPRCQTANSSHDAVCQRCGTSIPRRYLWAVGPAVAFPKEVGVLIQDRYYVLGDRLVLDTCPGLLPEIPSPEEELPEAFAPYLRLFPFRFSVPQIYGLLPGLTQPFFLLEGGAIYPQNALVSLSDAGETESDLANGPVVSPSSTDVAQGYRRAEGELMPSLTERWPTATPQRQLGWLWQIARLWEPFAKEGVAATLLNPDLLRVDGSMIRLLSLEASDHPGQPPSLGQLGQVWQPLGSKAHSSIAPFLQGLIARLLAGSIKQMEQLLPLLDQALALACTEQTMELQVATCTDSGPQRKQNEDACLPQGGTFRMTRPGIQSITLVCDGLGGHDGGEVASQLSADRIHRYLQTPSNLEDTTPGIAMQQAVHDANDQLLKRNNDEQRFLRQRMGTTVVMSWVVQHLTYLGHVGDSRIYRITPSGSSQLTVDDDVASLSVSQGQNIYRHAVRPAASGALTQALGITESTHLRPTIQRFFFDDEMLLLLCSDGLSDRNRVAQVWSRILLPIFTQKTNVAVSAKQLLEAANKLNGHDNSTIALVHCQIKAQPQPDGEALLALLDSFPMPKSLAQPMVLEPMPVMKNTGAMAQPSDDPAVGSMAKPRSKPRSKVLPMALGFLVLGTLGTLMGVGYQWFNREPASTIAPGLERDVDNTATNTVNSSSSISRKRSKFK